MGDDFQMLFKVFGKMMDGWNDSEKIPHKR